MLSKSTGNTSVNNNYVAVYFSTFIVIRLIYFYVCYCSCCTVAVEVIGQYLSGVATGIRLSEERVRQLPHPHGQRGRLSDGFVGVHHRAEERLQLRLRVPADVHDLLSGRGRAAVCVHGVAKVWNNNLRQ